MQQDTDIRELLERWHLSCSTPRCRKCSRFSRQNILSHGYEHSHSVEHFLLSDVGPLSRTVARCSSTSFSKGIRGSILQCAWSKFGNLSTRYIWAISTPSESQVAEKPAEDVRNPSLLWPSSKFRLEASGGKGYQKYPKVFGFLLRCHEWAIGTAHESILVYNSEIATGTRWRLHWKD